MSFDTRDGNKTCAKCEARNLAEIKFENETHNMSKRVWGKMEVEIKNWIEYRKDLIESDFIHTSTLRHTEFKLSNNKRKEIEGSEIFLFCFSHISFFDSHSNGG